MKQINNYIIEALKVGSKTKVHKSEPNNSDLDIQLNDGVYRNSIGDDLPIVDYAESPEEAIVMIERDSEEGDRFHWLRPLENGNYSAKQDFYWTKYTKEADYLLKSTYGTKYKKYNIESMYNTQHLILAKVEQNKRGS